MKQLTANSLPQATKERRPFLRRTKATAPPYTTDTDTTVPVTDTTTPGSTSKFRRGQSKFKSRKEEAARGNRVEGDRDRRPSLPTRSERPTRNFVRRRLGGANSTTSTTAAPVPSSSIATRRPFRVASRRRPLPTSSTTTTTTTEAPETDSTAGVASEEYLQDIDDSDVVEDPTLEPVVTAKKTYKIQRRPLVNLKEEVDDQNPSATNEDERKRQSKKYSATFKQNQLDAVLRQKAKNQEEGTTTPFDDFNPETAVAIAAHQLFAAPIPSIPNFDEEETKPTRKFPKVTTQYYTKPTDPYTDNQKTVYYEEFSSTPGYKSSTADYSTPVYKSSTQDYIATGAAYTGFSADFDTPKVPPTITFNAPKATFSSFEKDRSAVPTPTIINTGLSGIAPTNAALPRASTSSVFTSGIRSSPTNTAFTSGRSRSSPTNTAFTSGLARSSPTNTAFTTGLPASATDSVFTNVRDTSQEYTSVPSSTPRFTSGRKKLIPVPVEDYAFSTGAYSAASPEPAYFTREYLLESPVTKTYDDEYQYLSPITTPVTTTRKTLRKKIQRKISTTIRPTNPTNVAPVTTAKTPPRRVPARTAKPFEKVKPAPNRTYRPIVNYDYYDDSAEKVAEKYIEGTKVVLHAKGAIECLDIGNFPHPTSCKKFISCSRMETGTLIGWEYVCPKGLSFDPVGGICNWSAGLGCDEKDT